MAPIAVFPNRSEGNGVDIVLIIALPGTPTLFNDLARFFITMNSSYCQFTAYAARDSFAWFGLLSDQKVVMTAICVGKAIEPIFF
jgi:hypothetical protein